MIAQTLSFLQNRKTVIALLILGVLSFISFFLKIGSFPLLQFDESRQAVNAFEMAHNNNFLVTHFQNAPDMWSTKPPLFIWLVTLSFKLFGYSKVALRLPSALIGLSTALLLFFYCKKWLGDIKIGFFAALVLMTSWGYIGYHVSRTADYDVLLTFFTTLYVLSYFRFIHFGNNRGYIWFGVGVILAFFTKNIAGLIMLSGLFIYTISAKKLLLVLSSKTTYFTILSFVALAALFFGLREHYNPGYIKAMLENDVTGRYVGKNIGHLEPNDYYFQNLIKLRFSYWIYFLPLCIFMALKSKKYWQFALYLMCVATTYFLIVSFGKVKCAWYDAPIYPLLAIVIGIGLSEIFQWVKLDTSLANPGKSILLISAFTICVFGLPYYYIVKEINDTKELNSWNQQRYGDFMIKVDKKFPGLKNYKIVTIDYNAQLVFYANVFQKMGKEVESFDKSVYFGKTGDTVMTCRPECSEKIVEGFFYTVLKDEGDCKLYVLTGINHGYFEGLINDLVRQIREDSKWFDDIRRKAFANNIDLQRQLEYDAIYVLKMSYRMSNEEEKYYFDHHP